MNMPTSRLHRVFRFFRVVVVCVGLCFLLLSLGCSLEPQHEGCHRPKNLFGTMIQAMIDCKSRTDKGYVKGKAFTITVVTVDGKPVERETANAYYVMQQAAKKAGISIRVVSGFRTMAQQQYLYNCYLTKKCNNGNLAARPGYSNHQSGHALDLNTSASGVYSWMSKNAGKFGFKRTVPSEPWHWEWWGGGPGGGPCQSTCTPKCTTRSKFVGKDCKVGDCAGVGAYCTNDKLGLRCYSVFCPALGNKQVCVQGKLGTCKDGKLTLKACPSGKVCNPKPKASCVGKNKPKGELKVGCDGISGWAQDTDEPKKSLKVQLFFGGPAGSKSAIQLTLNANQHRASLCQALGSCHHAFSSSTPRRYLDGKRHVLYGYALDSETGERHLLPPGRVEVQCPYSPPRGLLRDVSSPAVFSAWRFSSLWDVMSALDADIMALSKGAPLPSKPTLVKADDGSPFVWLVDRTWRRPISGSSVMSAWRWSSKDVVTWPVRRVEALLIGTPWPPRPALVQDAKNRIYALDERQTNTPKEPPRRSEMWDVSDGSFPQPDSTDAPSEPAATRPDSWAEKAGQGGVLVLDGSGIVNLQPEKPSSGCSCNHSDEGLWFPLWGLGLALLFWVRRRNPA